MVVHEHDVVRLKDGKEGTVLDIASNGEVLIEFPFDDGIDDDNCLVWLSQNDIDTILYRCA